MKRLNKKELQTVTDITFSKTASIGLKHARLNAPYIKKTIKDIKVKGSKPALVVSAGPSLHNKGSLQKLKKKGFYGHIVAADGTLRHCLNNGIIPDFVVTVDPHPHRIVRWFGDTRLHERPDDDYFRRQDLDPALNRNEIEQNRRIIELVDKYGPRIKLIISTSVSPDITRRCIEAGMQLYWWNPLYDDYEKSDSFSRKIKKIAPAPFMVTGGNCGTSAWVFSHSVLNSPEVILIGMDLSYPPKTDVVKTQYYDILKEIFPRDPSKGLIKVYNPYLKQFWLTDPAYYWYSQGLIEMTGYAPCVTYNCTEGGIVFGKDIKFKDFSAVLNVLKRRKRKGKKV